MQEQSNEWHESVYERHESTQEHRSWAVLVGDHEVIISRDERIGGPIWEVDIMVKGAMPGRLSLLKMYPRFVAELPALSEQLAALLETAAAKMREMGLDDLRPDYERRRDEELAAIRALSANTQG